MTDSIFTDEELAADTTGEEAAAEQQQHDEGAEQEAQRARDEQGRFAKADEPVADDQADKPRGDGTVPQGALHAEREKRKASETERDSVKAELEAAREQLAAIAEMRRQIAERQPAALPASDDPAALDHLRSRIEEQGQQLNQFQQQQNNQALNDAETTQLRDVMATSEAEFRTVKPDYDAAIGHVVQARAQELALYGLTQPQIQQAIAEEARDIARSAVQQGRNPAELGYQIALSRGYRPDAPPQQQGQAAATLDALAKARDGSRSLSQAAGSTPQALNAEAIAAMDGDEFERLYSTPAGRAMIDAL